MNEYLGAHSGLRSGGISFPHVNKTFEREFLKKLEKFTKLFEKGSAPLLGILSKTSFSAVCRKPRAHTPWVSGRINHNIV